jgi:uncharacterized Rmd1/YagE family protein
MLYCADRLNIKNDNIQLKNKKIFCRLILSLYLKQSFDIHTNEKDFSIFLNEFRFEQNIKVNLKKCLTTINKSEIIK